MKIGIDFITTLGKGGLATYSRNLIDNLAAVDRENKYYLHYFFHDFLPGRKRPKFDNQNFKLTPAYISPLGLKVPESLISLINDNSIRFSVKLNRIDIFHFTNPLRFVSGIKNSVVTIHDLAVLRNKDWAKAWASELFIKKIDRIIKESKKIISVSAFTKKEIINFFNVEEEKITVIYEAAAAEYYPDNDREHLLEKFNLIDYILYAGQLQPRKNIIRLLKAFSILQPVLRDRYQLVLVGKPRDDSFSLEVNGAIKKLGLAGRVQVLGYVGNKDLCKLYSCAKFFIYPSLLEGFGLPILEAFNCGTPVITSKVSSMPELAGKKAAILVNPEDTEDIRSAMEKLLLDEQLYQSLKENTLSEAKKFSWQNAAEKTKKVYEDLYRESDKYAQ